MNKRKNILLTAKHKAASGGIKGAFHNENGAIDLASIMVGIIVIGLIGGVIAATVFAVIPWTQDNAAKHQLDSIVAAESAYMGLASDSPPALPSGHKANSFADSEFLASANLLQEGETYCAITTDSGKGYQGFAQSASGKIWSVTDKNTKPSQFTGVLPSDCTFITEGVTTDAGAGNESTPYVDPTPRLTVMTFKCDTATTGTIPIRTYIAGTETWTNDAGVVRTTTYNNGTSSTAKPTDITLQANVEYKVTFDGTYGQLTTSTLMGNNNLESCLRSLDHWGMETASAYGLSGYRAFEQVVNLTSVPDHIPAISSMQGMFEGATSFNDPSVTKWNVSSVTDMHTTFRNAKSFNQPLNNWDVSNVTRMSFTFEGASAFNQPLNDWNVSKTTTTAYMFQNATTFNQPLDKWNVSKVTAMNNMFSGATAFNHNLSGWNTVSVTNGASFAPTSFPDAYMPLKTSK